MNLNQISTILRDYLTLKQGSEDFKQIFATLLYNNCDTLTYTSNLL